MTRGFRRLRGIVLASYFGLLAWLITWQAWLSPPQALPRSLALVLLAGPLLLPLRGLLNGRSFTHIWASLLALFYFAHGIGEIYSNPAERPFAIPEVLLSITFYAAALIYVRRRRATLTP